MIKAIFLDVDGTLLSFRTHRVPDSAISALTEAHKKGIKLIIASGRPPTDMKMLSEVPQDAVIALNGTECWLPDGSLLYRYSFDRDDYIRVIELSEKYDFAFALENEDGLQANKINGRVHELCRLVNRELPPVVDMLKVFDCKPCCQLCLYCDQELEAKVMAELKHTVSSRWTPIFTNLNPAGINKTTGIDRIVEYFGIDKPECMAFGDGGNDIPMLCKVGVGVAMGNAEEETKNAACYVTDSVDNDGIAKALKHFGLI